MAVIKECERPIPSYFSPSLMIRDEIISKMAALLIPMILFMAHLNGGADRIESGATFSVVLFIVYALILAFSKTTPVNRVVFSLASAFLFWWLCGGFGPWPQARSETISLAAGGAALGVGHFVGSKKRSLVFAWTILIWTLLLYTILAVYMYQLAKDLPTDRLFGSFGSPNTAATLFSVAILLAVSKVFWQLRNPRLNRLKRGDRIAFLAQSEFSSISLVISASFALVLTSSRAGIVAGLLLTFALIAIEISRIIQSGRLRFLKNIWAKTTLGSSMLIIITLAITGEINPNNPEGLFHNLGSRIFLLEHYHSVWMEKPMTGHGLGSFNALNAKTSTLENAGALVTMGAAHNVLMQWLIQQGVLGLSAMTLVLAIVHKPIIFSISSSCRLPQHFLRATLAISILVYSHGMLDFALEIPSIMWTYSFILGLGSGYAHRIRSDSFIKATPHVTRGSDVREA